MIKSKFYNKQRRLDNLYKIIDKNKNEVTFRLNKAQRILRYIKRLDFKHRGCVRLLILKARQLGITTQEWIEKLDTAMMQKNRNIKISAHNQAKAIEIFEIIKYAYDKCPDKFELSDGTVWYKPTTKYDSKSELAFAENNSKIQVVLDTRSGTPSDVHSTELAFVKNARAMMTGTLPSLSKSANMTIETTANGAWGYFFELWKSCFWKKKAPFTCLFIPWFLDEWYSSPLEEWEVIVLPEELKHLGKFPITKEQKKRYIEKFIELWDEVFQEYPSDENEAFLTSWKAFFSALQIKNLPDLPYTEDFARPGLRRYKEIPEDGFWDLLFWVDTSEGLLGWDFGTVVVRNRKFELICVYRWLLPPEDINLVIDHIISNKKCLWAIGIEANNTGLVTIKYARDYRRFPYLYRRKVEDQTTRKKTKKLWFSTNGSTRPLILGDISRFIRKKQITEIDQREKAEMLSFVRNEDWKPEALPGEHDDLVMADAICCYMANDWEVVEIQDWKEEDDSRGSKI